MRWVGGPGYCGRMLEIHEKVTGPYTVEEDTALHGQINGTVTVPAMQHLYVHGQINGDLRIEAKAIVQVYGQVNGDVHNAGRLVVAGMLTGGLSEEEGSETVIQPGAVAPGH